MKCSGCKVTVVSEKNYNHQFPAINVLTEARVEKKGNFWLSQEKKAGPDQHFTLDLGCLGTIIGVRLINARNGGDRGTKKFRCALNTVIQNQHLFVKETLFAMPHLFFNLFKGERKS